MILKDFDSSEEWHFYNWLIEAEKAKLISKVWACKPETFELSPRFSVKYEKKLKTKIKMCDKFLFQAHSYTPDFIFQTAHVCLHQYFINPSFMGQNNILVDVKGTWSRDNSQKAFSINQKWMMDKFGLYIEKIVPEKLFKKTWVPEICRLSPKKRQPVKKYINSKTINEFIEKHV